MAGVTSCNTNTDSEAEFSDSVHPIRCFPKAPVWAQNVVETTKAQRNSWLQKKKPHKAWACADLCSIAGDLICIVDFGTNGHNMITDCKNYSHKTEIIN